MNWVMFAAIAGGAVSSIAIIAAVIKTLRWAGKLSLMYPVMMSMAMEFKSDAGSTLKDQVSRIETLAHQTQAIAQSAREISEVSRQTTTAQAAAIEAIRTEVLRLSLAIEVLRTAMAAKPVVAQI